jgi:hypothetical protein
VRVGWVFCLKELRWKRSTCIEIDMVETIWIV